MQFGNVAGARWFVALWPLVGIVACATQGDGTEPSSAARSALQSPGEIVWWEQMGPPTARSGHSLAYDGFRSRLVSVGGLDSLGRLQDTWEFTGAFWSNRVAASTLSIPPPRSDGAAVYDVVRRRVVLFGGRDVSGVLGDTWEWDGMAWLQRTPAVAPPPRGRHALAYDVARRRTVLFGGSTGAAELGDTWEWDGGTWLERPAGTAPVARFDHALAYDEGRQRTVLFGGVVAGNGQADTWEWDGAAWQERSILGPPARSALALSYDAARAKTVLFGGLTSAGPRKDTWEWDGATWVERTPAVAAESPSARSDHALGYDAVRQRVTLFGGRTASAALRDTWEWDGSKWTDRAAGSSLAVPAVRESGVLVGHPGLGHALLFGGFGAVSNVSTYFDDTWIWDGAYWRNKTPALASQRPPGRRLHNLAYDSVRNRVVVFGGIGADNLDRADTWEWDGAVWTNRTPASPAQSPSARAWPAMAFDEARGVTVLAGGYIEGEVWEWDGTTWTDRTPAAGAPSPVDGLGRWSAGFTYDPVRQRTVLFGGNAFGMRGDTWEWDGTSWTDRTPADPAASPTPRMSMGMTYDFYRQRIVLFGGFDGSRSLDDGWQWDGTSWSPLQPTNVLQTPAGRYRHAMAFDPVQQRVFLFGGASFYENSGHILAQTDAAHWQFLRGGACETAADSSTGFCVDGVACLSSSCGPCERCDAPGSRGTCTTVRLTEDPDTCAASAGQQCNGDGICTVQSGAACSDAMACASGFCVAGSCCESACEGSCQSCKGSENIVGRDGVCAPLREGLDPKDDCPDDGVDSCQRDGTCDGHGACRLYAQAVCNPCERTCTGPCESCQGSLNVLDVDGVCAPTKAGLDPKDDCPDEGPLSCKRDGTCDGARSCRLYPADACGQARCKNDAVLTVPGRADVECAPYSCADAACRTSCTNASECAVDAVCDETGHCVRDALTNAVPQSGCSCQVGDERAPSPGAALLLALPGLLLLGRRRRGHAALAVLALWGCASPEPERTNGVTESALTTTDTLRWLRVGNPAARLAPGLVYDDALHGLVLFGGTVGTSVQGDTWLRRDVGWVQRTPVLGAPTPAARREPGLAYDARRHRVVLHGGSTSVGVLDDTWEWDGRFWEERTTAVRPPSRDHGVISYDAGRGRTVLFGGELATGFASDTWEWDGSTWTESSSPVVPAARTEHAMTYDPDRQRTLLVGGRNLGGLLGDVWEWDGATWVQRLPVGRQPPARALAALAYDPPRHRAVLWAGQVEAGAAQDLWEWDGAAWSDRTPADRTGWPAARTRHTLAYDPARGRVVAVGGLATLEHWEWDGQAWTNLAGVADTKTPPWRYFHSIAYDSARDRTVLFGGCDDGVTLNHMLADTWEFDGAVWRNLTPVAGPNPDARMSMGIVYDPSRQRVVLFGGQNTTGRLRDTWEWDGAVWESRTPADPAASPPARSSHTLAYDSLRHRVILFGGSGAVSGAAGYLQDTWAWDGVAWTQLTPAAGAPNPPTRTYFGLAYDDARDRLTLQGGRAGTSGGLGATNDTWEWNGNEWANVTPADPTQTTGANTLHTVVFDPLAHRDISFGGWQSPGPVNATYVHEDGVWARRVSENVAPIARFGHGATYSTRLRAMVLFAGSGSVSDTWLLQSFGAACTGAADATTGFCVDGVSCDSASCGACERCDAPGSMGHCSAVVAAEDADSCTAAEGRVCDLQGRCSASLGHACDASTPCGTGQCVLGVCCDSPCDGTCVSCKGAENVVGRDGICAPTKAGLDPQDDCADDGTDSCQRDGTCDGQRACRLYTQAVCNPCERTCTGACESCKGSENIAGLDGVCAPIKAGLDPKNDCVDDGIQSCQRDGTCDGSRGCRLYEADVCGEAKCKDERVLERTGGERIDCSPYVCEGSACKTRCASVADCEIGAICNEQGACQAPTTNASQEGCTCSAVGQGGTARGAIVLLALLALGRRRRAR